MPNQRLLVVVFLIFFSYFILSSCSPSNSTETIDLSTDNSASLDASESSDSEFQYERPINNDDSLVEIEKDIESTQITGE